MKASFIVIRLDFLILPEHGWPPHAGSPLLPHIRTHGNVYVPMTNAFATYLVLADCWICTQIPYHAVISDSNICSDLLMRNYTFQHNGVREGAFARNCTQEALNGLLNDTWEPEFADGNPHPIAIHPAPEGLLCYTQPRTALHCWKAGHSHCRYRRLAAIMSPSLSLNGPDEWKPLPTSFSGHSSENQGGTKWAGAAGRMMVAV